jgi:hypothetical protein
LVHAATVTIPAGTKIFGELDQQVTSNKDEFSVGDMVRGHAWRNVGVGGRTVIEAGAPMVLRVSSMTKRKIAGRGGNVRVQAVSVIAVDGTEIFLDGGYDQEAGHRTGLAASLSALVAWPLIFIRGKEAVLEPGTVFDATIPANTSITVSDQQAKVLTLGPGSNLSVDVLYDEIEDKPKALPLKVTVCNADWPDSFVVTHVNEGDITPIGMELDAPAQQGACRSARGTVDLKKLSEHFTRGINRFSVSAGEESVEVILEVEM